MTSWTKRALLLLVWTICFGLPASAAVRLNTASRSGAAKTRKISEYEALSPKRKGTYQDLNLLRRRAMRALGSRFQKMAVDGDFRNRYVLYRDQEVTAFLDRTDPANPHYVASAAIDWRLRRIPASRRAHVLVVPNQKREHIGKRFGVPIDSSDVAATLSVMKKAEAIAQRLGIENSAVYVNPLDRLSVGYLHVHITGWRTRPYPARLESPVE